MKIRNYAYLQAVLEGNLRKIEEIIDVFIAMNGPREEINNEAKIIKKILLQFKLVCSPIYQFYVNKLSSYTSCPFQLAVRVLRKQPFGSK